MTVENANPEAPAATDRSAPVSSSAHPTASAGAPSADPDTAIHGLPQENLLRAASDPALTEDLLLALLQHPHLPSEALEKLAKNSSAMKLRKVKLALVGHPRTPRHVSVPLLRQFYTFDLMKIALRPGVPTDVKVAADQALVARLNTIALGERLTLARQGSGAIAGALLLDQDARVMNTALENSRLTEAPVIRAVLRPEAKASLVQAVSRHAKWSLRREVRLALLRIEFLSLARALEFSSGLPLTLLREVLLCSRLPASIKKQILQEHSTGLRP